MADTIAGLAAGLFGGRGLGFAAQSSGLTIAGGFTSSSSNTLTIEPGKFLMGEPEIKKPETALAWLDRRVEEMRVKL